MAETLEHVRDHRCQTKTPFAADPEKIQRARELQFEPPLDEGIREIVLTLISHGVETSESLRGQRRPRLSRADSSI